MISESLNFLFQMSVWIAITIVNFQHTHLDLILTNESYKGIIYSGILLNSYWIKPGAHHEPIMGWVRYEELCWWKQMLSTQQAASKTCIVLILSRKICQTHVKPQIWLLRADLLNNQPDVLQIVKNDIYFFPQRILYNTFVLRLLGEVVRTFYPRTIFFSLWSVPMEWTKIEKKYSSMHFQRLMYSKIKIAW